MDGVRAWVVCVAGVLCNSVLLGCNYGFAILYLTLLEEFQEGRVRTALVGSLAIALCGVFGPLVGKLIDLFCCRKIAIFGSATCVTSLLLTSQAPNVAVMYVTFSLLYGFGNCCVFIAVFVAVPTYFQVRRAFAIGLIGIGPGSGVFLMSPIIHALLSFLGWRVTFMCLAAITSLSSLFGWLFVPHKDTIQQNLSENSVGYTRPPRNSRKILNYAIWKNPRFAIITLSRALSLFGEYVPITHIARHCEDLGLSADQSTQIYLFYGLSCLISRAFVGVVCDWPRVNARYVFQLGVFLTTMATMMVPLATGYVAVFCYFVFVGLMEGAIATPFLLTVITSLEMRDRAQGYGFSQCVVSGTLAIGSTFAGFIADQTGSYNVAFYMAGTFELAGALLTFLSLCFNTGTIEAHSVKDVDDTVHAKLCVVERETVL